MLRRPRVSRAAPETEKKFLKQAEPIFKPGVFRLLRHSDLQSERHEKAEW
jgi:hypothetical protein